MTTIVVGTDLSENAASAARWALGLARLHEGGGESVEVVFAHALTDRDLQMRRVVSDHSEHRELEELEREVREWVDDAGFEDVSYEIEIAVGRPASALSKLTEDRGADWMIVGKSGKGRLERLFVGSTAEELAHCPRCATVLVHPDSFQWDRPLKVLSAVDLGKSSARAAGRGSVLVDRHGGELTILHVVSLPQSSAPILEGPPSIPDGFDDHLNESIQWARDELDARLEELPVSISKTSPTIEVRPGYPVREVLQTASGIDADLLTLGCRSRSRLGEWMLGSVGRSLLKKAPCSVMVTPAAQDGDP